jgi:hypothetical protein
MKLVPALRINGEIIKGDQYDHHNTLAILNDLPHPDEKSRGFVDESGNFLTRNQAVMWLRKNDIKSFRKLPSKTYYNGLHSEDLAKVYGITQRTEKEAKAEMILVENSPVKSEVVSLKDKTAIVYDRGGLYLYCAEKLAEKYGKVMYYLADADAYPTSQKATIGSGIKNIKRIHDFFKYVDEADVVYFFDCYDGEMQHWLREKGYKIFGSGRGEQLEIDKIFFLEALEKLKLPCAKTYLAEGMDDLCGYLKEHDNETLFLKNLHRGDFESRKFSSMAQSRPFLNDLRKRLGSASDTIEVLIQHKIDSVIEVGYDGFQINGEFTDNCIVGYEIKDRGFVGKIFPETPRIVKLINDAFSSTLKELGGMGNYSTELRITKDGLPYYIDPTQRVPSPPGELMCEIYENWAEATYQIAHEIVPELIPKAEFGAECILTSSWHEEHEIHVKFPSKYKEHIKLKNHTVRGGEYYCIPNGNGSFFGSVVAYADTLEEAIEKVKEVAGAIEADDYSFDDSMFNEACEAVEKGEQFGIIY